MQKKNKIVNLKHGYTNRTTREGNMVLKIYHGPGSPHRWTTESTLLSYLEGKLPVPKLVNPNRLGGIQTAWVNGSHAQDILEESSQETKIGQVMIILGQVLKQLQAINSEALRGKIPGDGTCLVHGDFGPQNLLLDSSAQQAVALMDWEWAHLGNPIEDVAWMEWSIRMHHQKQLRFLPLFYEHYGQLPTWEARHEAMIQQCQRHIEFARLLGNRKAIQIWHNRLVITHRFNRL